MAFSAHSDPEQVKEYECDPATLNHQAEQLAGLIKHANHFIAFSGAGISTSAGIADFRGPNGVWTMRAQGKAVQSKTTTSKAFPTQTHMALVTLQRAGHLKFMISQNCDGLHRRSGLKPELLAELHGNSNLDVCRKCNREFLRDFRARRRGNGVHDHETDRKCVCGSPLFDTIINFGENLPDKPLRDGFKHSKKSDLCLVLGSSLTVTPAADMPREAKASGGKLVICNMQKTPLDHLADIRIFAKTDDLMRLVMEKLDLPIAKWLLTRWITVDVMDGRVLVSAVDSDGIPASVISKVKFISDRDTTVERSAEPFDTSIDAWKQLCIKLYFFGHYNEPSHQIDVHLSTVTIHKKYRLDFDPQTGKWTQTLVEKEN